MVRGENMSRASALTCKHCGHLVKRDHHDDLRHTTGPNRGFIHAYKTSGGIDHVAETY